MQAYIQAEIYVIPYSLLLTGRHLWYIPHLDVRECSHKPCRVSGPQNWPESSLKSHSYCDGPWDPIGLVCNPPFWICVGVAYNFMKPKTLQEMCLGFSTSQWKPHQKIPICSGDTMAAYVSLRGLRYNHRAAVRGLIYNGSLRQFTWFTLQPSGRCSRVNIQWQLCTSEQEITCQINEEI